MKKLNRWLSVLMCMMMLCTSVLGDVAFAEEGEAASAPTAEVTSEPVSEPSAEAEVTKAPEKTEAPEEPEKEETPSGDSESKADESVETEKPEDSEAPETSDTPEEKESDDKKDEKQSESETEKKSEEKPKIDYKRDASKSPSFKLGYAELLDDARLYKNAEDAKKEFIATLTEGVVIVTDRKITKSVDRVKVLFADGEEKLTGWIDAKYVRPMDLDECKAFAKKFKKQAAEEERDPLWFDSDKEIPLPEPEYEVEKKEQSAKNSATAATLSGDVKVPAEDENEEATLTFDCDALTLTVDQTQTIKASTDSDAEVTYKSSDENVATVDETGLVTAIGKGECEIIASAGEELTAKCSVSVEAKQLDEHLVESVDNPSENKAEALIPDAGNLMAVGNGNTATGNTSENSQTGTDTDKSEGNEDQTGTDTGNTDGDNDDQTDTDTGNTDGGNDGQTDTDTGNTDGGNDDQTGTDTDNTDGGNDDQTGTDTGNTDGGNDGQTDTDTDKTEGNKDHTGTDTDKTEGNKDQTGTDVGNTDGGNDDQTDTDTENKEEKTVLTVENCPSEMEVGQNSDPLICKLTKGKETVEGYVTVTSSNTSVVAVNSGSLKAIKAGTATITFASAGVDPVVKTVVVKDAVLEASKIVLEKKQYEIVVGQTFTLPVRIQDKNGNDVDTDYELKSNSESYLSVSGKTVKALKIGSVVVRVEIPGTEIKEYVTFKIVSAPMLVQMSSGYDNIKLGVGMSLEMKVRVYASNGGENFHVTPDNALGVGEFTSSNPAVAEVTENGVVTAKATGNAVITFKTINGKSCTATVTVYDEPLQVKLNYTKLAIAEGATAQLTATFDDYAMGAVTFTTSDASVATVSEDGLVSAVRQGIAVITARVSPSVYAECVVTVSSAPVEIVVDSETINLALNQKVKLPVTFKDASGNEIAADYTLKANSSKYIAVSGHEITGLKTGKAVLRIQVSEALRKDIIVNIIDAPTMVEMSSGSRDVKLGVGMTKQLTARVYCKSTRFHSSKDDTAGLGRFTSSNPEIAEVSASGELKALSTGTATVTFITVNGKSCSTTVTVYDTPMTVRLNKYELSLAQGASFKLVASFENYAMGDVYYSSADPTVAIVDASGNITAVGQGTVLITAKVSDDVAATCTVTVTPAPTKMTVDGDTFYVTLGQKIQLPVKFENADGETTEASYYLVADSSKYLEISGQEIKGIKAGSSKVRVGVAGSAELYKIVTVKVVDAPTKVEMSSASRDIKLGIGMSQQLVARVYCKTTRFHTTASEVNGVGQFYTSSNNSVIEVTAGGLVTGLKPGEATVTFLTSNGKTTSAKVTVYDTPITIALDKTELSLAQGASAQLTPKFEAYAMGKVNYESSDESVARVDANGKVTAVHEGTAIITATIDTKNGNGKSATCRVTVSAAPSKIVIDSESYNVIVGQTIELPLSFQDAEGQKVEANYELKSSNSAIVKITDDNRIQAVKTGSAYVRVRVSETVEKLITINAVSAPTLLEMSSGSRNVQLGEGMTFQMKVRVYCSGNRFHSSPSDALGVGKYVSSDPSVVEVTDGGLLTAKKAGTATIMFKAYSGKSCTTTVTVRNAPTSIQLDKDYLTMTVGAKETLVATFDEFSIGQPAFESVYPEVATVDQNGVITAVAPGVTLITAKISDDVFAQCRVNVVAGAQALTLNQTSSNLCVGGKVALTATCTLADGSVSTSGVTWRSSNTDVATVDSNGVVRGVKVGSATITASIAGKAALCTIIVRPTPTSVLLDKQTLTLSKGSTAKVRAKVFYDGGSFMFSGDDSAIGMFGSTNKNVVTVDSNGVVTAVGAGRAGIYLCTYNNVGMDVMCEVTVSEGDEWIEFEKSELTLNPGETDIVYCNKSAGSTSTRSYVSSNASVVTVVGNDSYCEITAVGSGEATITAKSSGGATAELKVIVVGKPQKVAFEKGEYTLSVKQSGVLPKVTVTAAVGTCDQTVTYSVDNEDVISVSADGIVTALKVGTATVTATAIDGKTSGTCKVTVLAEPTKVELSVDKDVLSVGETAKLTVKMDVPANYEFSASEKNVVDIARDGTVTAKKDGKVTIYVTTYNNITDSCELTIAKQPESITLTPSSVTLNKGEIADLTVESAEGTLGRYEFLSTNEKVATVDANGKVTAVGAGKAQIYAQLKGASGVFDVCSVTVNADVESSVPSKLVMEKSEYTMTVGEQTTLKASVLDQNGKVIEIEDFEFEEIQQAGEGGEDVVAFDQSSATMKAVKEGTATITVRWDHEANGYDLPDGKTLEASFKVTVKAKPEVYFEPSELNMVEGDTADLKLIGKEGVDYVIKSDSDEVAKYTIGKVMAVSAGTAKIVATEKDKEEPLAECIVTVSAKPVEATGIKLLPGSAELYVEHDLTLVPVFEPEGATGEVTFSSDATNIAVVDPDTGVVTGIQEGTATITASCGDLHAECEVTVKEPPVMAAPMMVRFAEIGDIIMSVDSEYVLSQPVFYSEEGASDADYTVMVSWNDSVSLNQNDASEYVLSAAAAGEATLRIKTDNGLQATKRVIVVEKATSIDFVENQINMAVGEAYTPEVVGNNDAPVSAKFTSSDEKIVKVENGSLVAVSEGSATITAASGAMTATVTVKVCKEATKIYLPETLVMCVGDINQLAPTFDDGAAAANVTFASSDESIVNASSDGKLYAAKVGEATVTATYKGIEAKCNVMVLSELKSMTVEPQSISACIADVIEIKATFDPVDAKPALNYKSSDETVAKVDKDGKVTFLKPGQATITVSTYNLSETISVTVGETPTKAAFAVPDAKLVLGDSAPLEVEFDKGAAYYTLEVTEGDAVSIDEFGCVKGEKVGKSVVTMTVPALKDLEVKCNIEVVAELDTVVITATAEKLELNEAAIIDYETAENVLGTGLVTLELEPTECAEMTVLEDGVRMLVALSSGKAAIVAKTQSGKEIARKEITVVGGKRRALIAYYYYGTDISKGYLPFSKNNAYSMSSALQASAPIDGQRYDVSVYESLSKSSLLGKIDNMASTSSDDDVSVIYICTHGHQYGNSGEYAMSIGTSVNSIDREQLSATTFMTHVRKIKGKVVVIMDSCNSGGLIDCTSGILNAEGGRIAVLTSSAWATSSCYYADSQWQNSVDIYTMSLLRGIGYNESSVSGSSRGYTGSLKADRNGDGVSLSELSSYATNKTLELIPWFKKKYPSKFYGNTAQTPRCWISSEMQNLILVK